MQISQVSHTPNQILFRYDEKTYLSQFVSEIFYSLQQDSTKCTPQYELNSSVAMAPYWVPDLPILKAFLANNTSYELSSKHINMLAQLFVVV